MLDERVLAEFISGFYGYGNYQARFWFVGMEEGGGNSTEEISRRIGAWDKRGRKELEDLPGYHRAFSGGDQFDNRPKLQPTWKQLIRIYLTATGQSSDTEIIRDYQQRELGTIDGDTCLLELLPLPSPNANDWLFHDIKSLPYLMNRDTYRGHTTPLRIAHLRAMLARDLPRTVVFYGLTYKEHWAQIAGVMTWRESPAGVVHGSKDQTLFIMAKHPAATGVSNEYFRRIGELVREMGLGSA